MRRTQGEQRNLEPMRDTSHYYRLGRGGGEAESENFGGNTGGTEKFIANEEHQSLFIAWEEGCGVRRL